MEKKGKGKKIAIGIILLVILGSGGYFAYQKYFKVQPKPTQNYTRVKAKMDSIDVTVSASGTVASAVTQEIFTTNKGVIELLPFKEGDKVTKGEVVAKIKDDTTEQDIEKAQNTVAQQQLSLEKLKRSMDNSTIKAPMAGTIRIVNIAAGDDLAVVGKALQSAIIIEYGGQIDLPIAMSSGIVSDVYVTVGMKVNKGDNLFKLKQEDIQDSIEAQELVIAQTQRDIKSKQDTLAKETITSPVDGMIATQSYNSGDTVEVGKALATIINPEQMQTVVAVDELDISKVQVGLKAKIALDAIPDKGFDGEVLKISNVGKVANGVTTYDVTLSISDPINVKIGMTANAKISIQRKENVIVLPLEAIQGKGADRFVMVSSTVAKQGGSSNSTEKTTQSKVATGQASSNQGTKSNATASTAGTRTKVEVGIMNETSGEIVSGLKGGEEILIPSAKSSTATTQRATTTLTGGGGFQGGGARGN